MALARIGTKILWVSAGTTVAAPIAAALAIVPLVTFFFAFFAFVPAILAVVGALVRWLGRRASKPDPPPPVMA